MQAHRHVVPPLASTSHLTLDETEMREWGEKLGRSITKPLTILLTGEMGSGKTTLAQAICAGYGVKDPVTSPTYAIVHRYSSPHAAVYHVDLYRLDDVSQLTNIGWDDIVAEDVLLIVEWPERGGDRMPEDHLHIDIEYAPGDQARRVLLAG